MRSSSWAAKFRLHWPFIVLTTAVVWGLPILTGQADRRPGLAGLPVKAEPLPIEAQRSLAGYHRPQGSLPYYGFLGARLNTPLFDSWWDGRHAATKLRELDANTIVISAKDWLDESRFSAQMTRLAGAGLRVLIEVTEPSDWGEIDALGSLVSGSFSVTRATSALARARQAGLSRFADAIVISGDAMLVGTHEERRKMFQVVKQYFPAHPVARYYGAQFIKAESLGGVWDERRFGPDECDLAMVELASASRDGSRFRMRAILDELNEVVAVVKSRQPDGGLVIVAAPANESLLKTTPTAMWTGAQIDKIVGAVLTSDSVEGLLVRSMGAHPFDLGHRGFEAQRRAFKLAAPSLPPDSTIQEPNGIVRSSGASEPDREPASD